MKYKIHTLKTWPEYFNKVVNGEKKFEVRKNDRNFKVGDYLSLNEYDPKTLKYTGYATDLLKITYILEGVDFGIEKGYCVMSLA